MVFTFGIFFSSSDSLFLPISSSFFPFFPPFLIQFILQIYLQEFGTDCLGLVSNTNEKVLNIFFLNNLTESVYVWIQWTYNTTKCYTGMKHLSYLPTFT